MTKTPIDLAPIRERHTSGKSIEQVAFMHHDIDALFREIDRLRAALQEIRDGDSLWHYGDAVSMAGKALDGR